MPLAPTAPWIIPPDYTGAMARGAQLGLSARNQDIQEKDAADRLTLAYKQLSSQEERATEAAKERQAAASEMLAYHTKVKDLMGEYNKQRLAADAAKKTPAAAEGLITQDKDGKTYLSRGGNWYHIPSSNPLMDTVTEKIPGNPGTPASPEIPAAKHWYGDQPFVPATPAVEAHGEITRTRKVPSGLPTFSTATPKPAAAALTAKASPGMALPQGHAIPPNNPATGMPSNPMPASSSAPVKVRRKSDGKTFTYKGRADEVPTDEYELL